MGQGDDALITKILDLGRVLTETSASWQGAQKEHEQASCLLPALDPIVWNQAQWSTRKHQGPQRVLQRGTQEFHDCHLIMLGSTFHFLRDPKAEIYWGSDQRATPSQVLASGCDDFVLVGLIIV